LLQALPQSRSVAGQVMAQRPALQTGKAPPAKQTDPQAPQFWGSLASSTQVVPQ
jgi:hypothetical protein